MSWRWSSRLVRVLFYRGGALSGKAKSYRVVQALTDAVDRTYREPLDLSSLAREFFFTPGYLCRVFKQRDRDDPDGVSAETPGRGGVPSAG